MPSSTIARLSATPATVPSAMPVSAPSSDISTDSRRTTAAHLPAGRADGPHQAELAGALHHREHQGVDDAEDRDDDREQRAAR